MELTKLGLSQDSANDKRAEDSPSSPQYYVPVWQSEKQIKDVGVRAALQSDDIDKIVSNIIDSFKLSLDSQEKIFQSKLNAFNEQKARLVSKYKNLRTLNEEIYKKIETLETDKDRLCNELLKKRQERPAREAEFFRQERQYLTEEVTQGYNELLNDIDNRKKLAENLTQIKKHDFELNRETRASWIHIFKKQCDKIDLDLEKCNERAAILRKALFTDNTADFLIWGGCSSLVGIIYYFSIIFEEKNGNSNKFLLGMKFLINGTISIIQDGVELYTIKNAAVFVLTITCLIYIVLKVVEFMDQKLKKYDPNWLNQSNSIDKIKREQNSSNKTNLSINSLGLDFTRQSYTRLLTAIPYLFVGTILLAFVGIIGKTYSGKISTPSVAGFQSVYLAFTFIILLVSTSLIYTYTIIIPRWKRIFSRDRDSFTILEYLISHWEILLAIPLLITCITLYSVANSMNSRLIVAAKIFGAVYLCLGTLWFAYGIVQRGVLKDIFELEIQRYRFQALIDYNANIPNLWDHFDRETISYTSERFKYHHNLRAIYDNQRINKAINYKERLTDLGQQALVRIETFIGLIKKWIASADFPRKQSQLPLADTPVFNDRPGRKTINSKRYIPAYQEEENHIEVLIADYSDKIRESKAKYEATQELISAIETKLDEFDVEQARLEEENLKKAEDIIRWRENQIFLLKDGYRLGQLMISKR